MKKTFSFMNKASTFLGTVLIVVGLILFVVRQMSPDNPQNNPSKNNPVISQTISSSPSSKSQTASYSATFAVFTNGTFRVFTDSRYHNTNASAFISPEFPNRVQVQKNGITWQDFFNSLPMKVSPDCLTTGSGQTFCTSKEKTLRFFLNGVENPQSLSKTIESNDHFLITYGSESGEMVSKQIQRLKNL